MSHLIAFRELLIADAELCLLGESTVVIERKSDAQTVWLKDMFVDYGM